MKDMPFPMNFVLLFEKTQVYELGRILVVIGCANISLKTTLITFKTLKPYNNSCK